MKTTYTKRQLEIVDLLVRTFDLNSEQISFDEDGLTPIFDFEAVCALTLQLVPSIKNISCEISERNFEGDAWVNSTARCTVELIDGRRRTAEDSAIFGEDLKTGLKIDDPRRGDGLAMTRAVRRGVRSVGINLWLACKKYIETGNVAIAHTRHDPRATDYADVHLLAGEIGLIRGTDRSEYETFLAASFDGVTSSTDLNDLDLKRLVNQLRSLARAAKRFSAAEKSSAK